MAAENITVTVDVPAVTRMMTRQRVSCGETSLDLQLAAGTPGQPDERWKVRGDIGPTGQLTAAEIGTIVEPWVQGTERHRLAEANLDVVAPPPT